MWWYESRPLSDDELEVKYVDESQVEPDAHIVEYFGPATSVEVPEYSVVKVRLVSHVQNTEVAGVVAENSGEENDDEGADISGLEGIDGQEEDEASYHPVDHAYDSHGGAENFLLFNFHWLLQMLQLCLLGDIAVWAFLINYMAAREAISEILQTLRVKNIEELLSGDCFNVEQLSKSISMHPILINELLEKMHTLLTIQQDLQEENGLELQSIVDRWHGSEWNQIQRKEIDMRVVKGDVIEILGRTNAGKSYLLNQLVVQALEKQYEVIFLDSGNNLPALVAKVRERLGNSPQFKSLKLRHLTFSSLSELFMMLFHIKQQIEASQKFQYFIFIDTISRNEQPELQNSQTISSHEFKYAEKARVLLRLLSSKTAGIVYTNRLSHSPGMFNQVYKHERYRPKGHGSNSKQWDNIANKTFLVDFTPTEDGEEHWWLHCSKSTDSSVYKFKRIP